MSGEIWQIQTLNAKLLICELYMRVEWIENDNIPARDIQSF